MKENGKTSKSAGTFWPLGTAGDKVEDERMPGTLELSPEGIGDYCTRVPGAQRQVNG